MSEIWEVAPAVLQRKLLNPKAKDEMPSTISQQLQSPCRK
jgi:hypothetical protein